MHACIPVNTCIQTKGFWVWALARAQTYVRLHNIGSYTKVFVIQQMCTCEYMHVYKEVLSVSPGKGTDICEFVQLDQPGFIHTGIYNMIYVYLWIYVCILYKELQSVSTRQETDICEFAQHEFIHESIWNMICVYLWVYVCIQRGSKCEHLQGHRRIRVAQFGFIYKSIYDTIHVYLWIYVYKKIQTRDSKCKHSQGHKHT